MTVLFSISLSKVSGGVYESLDFVQSILCSTNDATAALSAISGKKFARPRNKRNRLDHIPNPLSETRLNLERRQPNILFMSSNDLGEYGFLHRSVKRNASSATNINGTGVSS